MNEQESELVMTLADCTNTLLREIACRNAKRLDVAKTYHLAMLAEQHANEKVDWAAVNKAIIARWSFSALNWIKKQAHSGKCWEQKLTKGGA